MGLHSIWVCLFGLILVNSASGAQQGTSSPVELPFRLYQDQLVVVRGELGNLKKLNFVIDTGGRTIIDQSVARKLGLEGGTTKLRVIDGEVGVRTVAVPSLRLGPIYRENVPAAVMNLAPLKVSSGFRIDVLIGLDVLHDHSFRIDYAAHKLIFGSFTPDCPVLPFANQGTYVTVSSVLDGQPVKLMVDTGGSGVILFRSRFDVAADAVTGQHWVANLVGKVKMAETRPANLRLGEADFGEVETFFTDDPSMTQYEFEGLLGISSLHPRQITFDFEHRVFSWQPEYKVRAHAMVGRGGDPATGLTVTTPRMRTPVPMGADNLRTNNMAVRLPQH